MDNKTDPDSPHEDETLPQVSIPEVMGLVEVLRGKGGREDIYKLAAELKMEFGGMLSVIRAAELLGLVHTPGGDVVLEDAGMQISKASIKKRKELMRAQLGKIPVFAEIRKFVSETEDHEVTRSEILEKLVELLPNADAESSFKTLVSWARYAELFGYNDDQETFYLDQRK